MRVVRVRERGGRNSGKKAHLSYIHCMDVTLLVIACAPPLPSFVALVTSSVLTPFRRCTNSYTEQEYIYPTQQPYLVHKSTISSSHYTVYILRVHTRISYQ